MTRRHPFRGMIAPGAFDFVENYGLIRLLIGEGKAWWPPIAYWCAVFKFILVGIGLAYLVVGFVTQLVHRGREGEWHIAWLARRRRVRRVSGRQTI